MLWNRHRLCPHTAPKQEATSKHQIWKKGKRPEYFCHFLSKRPSWKAWPFRCTKYDSDCLNISEWPVKCDMGCVHWEWGRLPKSSSYSPSLCQLPSVTDPTTEHKRSGDGKRLPKVWEREQIRIFSKNFFYFIYLFWERECVWAGERQIETENPKQGFCTGSTRLDPTNHEIMTWAEIKSRMFNWLRHPWFF